MAFRVGIVVGEVSGDELAAKLLEELKNRHPELKIEGILGPRLLQFGGTQLFPMERLSVMGFVDPLFRLWELFKIRKFLIRYFLEDPPDLFIGVDAPAFNIGLEAKLREGGIPTVHYVSPSVWAWRQNRIHGIKKAVDLMLTLFPFEKDIYHQHQIPVHCVGHPAADQIPLSINPSEAQKKLNLSTDRVCVALLPGSRESELRWMVPLYLETAALLLKSNPEIQFLMPVVQERHREQVLAEISKQGLQLPLTVVVGDTRTVLSASKVALVTSGTATLETLLHKIPMLIAYKTHWLTYQIARRLVKVPYIGLPNLLGNALVSPEFIQEEATAERLSAALGELLNSNARQQAQIQKFEVMHRELRQNASVQAADAILEMLE